MPAPIARRVEIAAPAATVWAFLDDDERIKSWMPEVVDIRYPQGRNAAAPLGPTFVQSIKERGRTKDYDGVVTAYESECLLVIRLGDGKHFHVDVTNRREPRGAADMVRYYEFRMTTHSWLACVMMPIGRPLMRRMLDR
jgi:uncharacterized protein YndB with AHSA1/START domain